jgi:transposase-like protein
MEDRTFDLDSFCCQNQRCVAYGSVGAGNLTTAGYVDPAKTIRQLKCRTCGRRFSSRKGTVFYRSHLSPAEVADVLAHVSEGCGMRQTGRLTGHKEDTVIRYAQLAGAHARGLHDQLVAFSPADHGTSA